MRVALYARVSTDEQADEGFSIEGQISNLTDECKKHNYTVHKVYKDEGFSGKSIDRPGIQALLHDCQQGMFDMVMVWKFNRLSRKQLDFLGIIDQFEQNRIAFYSQSEKIDASTPTGKAMLQMMGTFAELERNQIVENVKMGMNQRAKEGKWNGGIVLGYESENKNLVLIENEAQIVRHIFSLYIQGRGFKTIANQLNHEGYKTKRGNAFGISTVREIITNPLYAGFIRFNQYEDWVMKKRKGKNESPMLQQGQHTPIIDRETWNTAQTLFKQRAHKPVKTFFGHFPLTTLLRCPDCGHGMISHKVKKKDYYIRYYQCGNFHYKGSAVCRSNVVRADDAEAAIFKKIEDVSSNSEHLRSIVDRVNGMILTHKEPLVQQMSNLDIQIKKAKSSIEKYLSLFENSKLSSNIVSEKIMRLEEELKELNEKKIDLEHELSKPTVKEISFDQVQQVLSQFSKVLPKVEPEKQKDLLHTIINKITVNQSSKRGERRTIKEVELYFDLTPKEEFVLTCGKVPPAVSETLDKPAPTKSPSPSGAGT